MPERWPAHLNAFWWNAAAPARSQVTAAAVLALLLWPAVGVVNAPVASTIILEAVRGALLLGVALYYRAAVLSA
jgi:hypothetical protein